MAVVLSVGACAGDKRSGKPGGARGRYIDQVDPICKGLNATIGKLGDDALKERDEINAAVDAIRAIKPSGEERDQLEVFIIKLGNVALAMEDVNQSRRVNNQGRVDTALKLAHTLAGEAADSANGYGFEECSQPIDG